MRQAFIFEASTKRPRLLITVKELIRTVISRFCLVHRDISIFEQCSRRRLWAGNGDAHQLGRQLPRDPVPARAFAYRPGRKAAGTAGQPICRQGRSMTIRIDFEDHAAS